MNTQDGYDWPNNVQDERWPVQAVATCPLPRLMVVSAGVPVLDLKPRPGSVIVVRPGQTVHYWI